MNFKNWGLMVLAGIGLSGTTGFALESWPDLRNTPLIVEGTVTKIQEPLFAPTCAANCQSMPNFEFHVDRVLYGQAPGVSLNFGKYVAEWPELMMPYKEGVHGILFVTYPKGSNETVLRQALPPGRGEWKPVSSREDLVNEIKKHWTAEVTEGSDSRAKAELIGKLAPLLNATEAENIMRPLLGSSDDWVRHAAIGTLLCADPSPENVAKAKKDLEPGLRAVKETFIGVGTLDYGGQTHKQIMPMYYPCISGNRPKEGIFADLWDWMDRLEREAHPDEWPNKKENLP